MSEQRKQYRKDNEEKIKAQAKLYYQKNKLKISARKKLLYKQNKEAIVIKNAKNYLKNKDAINKKRYSKITCKCGSIIARGQLRTHLKTKKHTKLLNKLLENN